MLYGNVLARPDPGMLYSNVILPTASPNYSANTYYNTASFVIQPARPAPGVPQIITSPLIAPSLVQNYSYPPATSVFPVILTSGTIRTLSPNPPYDCSIDRLINFLFRTKWSCGEKATKRSGESREKRTCHQNVSGAIVDWPLRHHSGLQWFMGRFQG